MNAQKFDYYLPFSVIEAQMPAVIVNPDSDKIKLVELEFYAPYLEKPNLLN